MIAPQAFEQFFNPLVGDEARVDALRAELAAGVNTFRGAFEGSDGGSDPFDRLARTFERVTFGAAMDLDRGLVTPNEKASLRVNVEFGGEVTIHALRAICSVYESRAGTPQGAKSVSVNTTRILRNMHTIAFGDKHSGVKALWAFTNGKSPGNPLALIPAFLGGKPESFTTLTPKTARSIHTAEDERGQLTLKPRHLFKQNKSDGGCPAAKTTVTSEGKNRSALFTLMRTLGDVAVAEIFPHYFDIVPSHAPTEPEAAGSLAG